MTVSDPPLAGCPFDGTPLIATFEQPHKEWHCMTCGRWLEWLAARDNVTNPDTYEPLLARFRAGERGPITTPAKEIP